MKNKRFLQIFALFNALFWVGLLFYVRDFNTSKEDITAFQTSPNGGAILDSATLNKKIDSIQNVIKDDEYRLQSSKLLIVLDSNVIKKRLNMLENLMQKKLKIDSIYSQVIKSP